MPLYALCDFSLLSAYFIGRAIVMSNSLFNFHFLYQNIRHKVRTCQAFYSLFFSLPPGPG